MTDTFPLGRPYGSSALAEAGIGYIDDAGSDCIVRTRVPVPLPGDIAELRWKCEDLETMSGPLYEDSLPAAEISQDGGQTWHPAWYELDHAKWLAEEYGVPLQEV